MSSALVLIADGTEEMEAVIVIDVLRRAGCSVVVAATASQTTIKASRGVRIVADALLAEIGTPMAFDLLVLPGGKDGAETFSRSPNVQELLKSYDRGSKWIAAICAAPLALDAAGILRERRYTCYPGIEQGIASGQHITDVVVRDENLVTSRGPGTAMQFALTLVALLENKKAADELRRQMVLL